MAIVFRRHKRPVGTSWRMDDTYIKVAGQWKYLYRAVDKEGDTVDFLLTAKRDKAAARRLSSSLSDLRKIDALQVPQTDQAPIRMRASDLNAEISIRQRRKRLIYVKSDRLLEHEQTLWAKVVKDSGAKAD